VYPKVYNEYDRMAMLMMNTIQTTDVFDIVILLAGGDKSSQKQDIKTALALARQL
jgi:putative component of toxin-antitoxin plasmid stabilization module